MTISSQTFFWRIPVAVVAILLLAACSSVTGSGGWLGGSAKTSARSHGASIKGYGAITFGMDRTRAHQAVGGRGAFQRLPNGKAEVLVYDDYIDYLAVRVVQHFDDKGKAVKAEAYAADGQRPIGLADCQGLYQTVYGRLHATYGLPDWDPREESRRYGRSGVLMYTFADASHITLNYDFITQGAGDVGLCTVRMTVAPSAYGGGDGDD